ncbi:Nn.00g043430.m01.CDS01 [Neocucurbitaria sp. VM-36]
MAPSGVNAFYYYSFTVVDPFLSLLAVYMNYFDPLTILDPAFPRTSPYKWNPTNAFLQHQAGGAFAMFAFLMIFMLRYTNDLGVWKLFQGGLLFTDFAALFSMFKAIQAQGGEIRSEATTNIAIIAVITIVRVLFVAGVGVGIGPRGERKRA